MENEKELRDKRSQKIFLIFIAVATILFIVFIFLYPSISKKLAANEEKITRKIKRPAVADRFYPASKEVLSSMIDDYFQRVETTPVENIRGLVSPHAGYIYSGPVAAYGYSLLQGKTFDTVIVMGPSHHVRFKGASIPDATHIETPLGLVEVSPKTRELLKEKYFGCTPEAHTAEHSVEVQIPFLQEALKDFKIIPIVTGDVDPEKLADILMKYVDDKTLIVASSDLSHNLPYDEATKIDKFYVRSIINLNPSLFNFFNPMLRPCGRTPISVLVAIAEKKGWSAKALDYRNSGDITGEKSTRIVGYTSIVFYKSKAGEEVAKTAYQPITLKEEEQKFLLKLARESIENILQGKEPEINTEELSENLRTISGVFVTLTKNGKLRGCIGDLLPLEELYKGVMQNAVRAAVRDRRFLPVKLEEMEDIDIEISILSMPRKLKFKSPQELLEELTPNKDGVILIVGERSATYLPQVWEKIPDKEEFLSRLSVKAGLRSDSWKRGDAKIFTYQAQAFEEEHKESEESGE